MPFWKGDGVGRPAELGRAIGEFSRWAVDREPEELCKRLRPRRARGQATSSPTCASSARPRAWCRPTARSWSSASATRSATGGCACCRRSAAASTPPGRWRCRRAHPRRATASSPTRSGRTTGSSSTSPTRTSRRAPSSCWSIPTSSRTWWCASCRRSALFGARFRENAARALLLPRAYPGKRTPLWQQRLKAQSLLEVAKRYGQFPIVLETYRECLRDVLDLPGLEELLRGLHTRELSLVEVETPRASPFASSLLFDYVATYMYEGDTPNAERRAAALSLDRDLLRELLGQEELRELIDPVALDEVEADLQRLSERTRAANADGLHDVLRALGDLTAAEAQERCLEAVSAKRMLERAARRSGARCACGSAARSATSPPRTPGLYRDALGAVPPGGLPGGLPRGRSRSRCARIARRYARTHGPFTTARARRPLRRGRRRRCCASSSAPATSSAASCAPAAASASGATPRCCGACAARRWRRCARRWSRPTSARWRGCMPAWQGVDSLAARAARASTACARSSCRSRAWRSRPRCGSATCCRGASAPTRQAWMDQLCAGGELVWVGAGALGRSSRPGGALLPRRRALARPAAEQGASRRRSRCTRPSASGSSAAPPSGPTCSPTSTLEPLELQEALWDLVWAGEVTNDAFAPLRAPRLSLARAAARSAAARRFAPPPPAGARRRSRAAGRSPRRCSRDAPAARPAHARARRAAARALRHRHARDGAGRGRARRLLRALRRAGEPRDARHRPARLLRGGPRRRAVRAAGGAVERLRGLRERRARRRAGAGRHRPANPYGATLPWPKREDDGARPPPGAGARRLRGHARRRAGALRRARRQGPAAAARAATTRPAARRRSRRWPTTCAAAASSGSASSASTASRVVGSPIEPLLIDVGFRQGPAAR